MDVIEESSQEGYRSTSQQPTPSHVHHEIPVEGIAATGTASNHQFRFGVDVHPTTTTQNTKYPGPPVYGRARLSAPTIVELALRISTIVFSIIAFSVMAATSQNGFKFDNYGAFNYLLAINVLAFLYSALHVGHLTYKVGSGRSILPNNVHFVSTFVCDQILAYLLMSASSAGANSTVLSENGLGNAWGAICNGLSNFCSMAEASVSMSFLAFFCVALSALLSGYQLLYSLKD